MINEEQEFNKNEVSEKIEKTINYFEKKVEQKNDNQIAHEKLMKDMADFRKKDK
jgi:hypothetical protein